jgi:hypothetical protein
MADPVASGSSRKPDSSSYDDAVCREEAQATTAPAKAASSTEPKPQIASHDDAVAQLPAREIDYSQMAAATPKPTNSNLERTTARDGVAPYAAAGATTSGDAVFAGAALLKGRNSESGIEAEVLTGSVQVGLETEAQVGLLRIGASKDDGTASATVDAFTARAAIGIHNPDGSTGLNLGLSATTLGFEGSHTFGSSAPKEISGRSDTGGAALGVGGEASIGLRDADHDGRLELCVRMGAKVGTIGYCLEKPW